MECAEQRSSDRTKPPGSGPRIWPLYSIGSLDQLLIIVDLSAKAGVSSGLCQRSTPCGECGQPGNDAKLARVASYTRTCLGPVRVRQERTRDSGPSGQQSCRCHKCLSSKPVSPASWFGATLDRVVSHHMFRIQLVAFTSGKTKAGKPCPIAHAQISLVDCSVKRLLAIWLFAVFLPQCILAKGASA